MLGYATVRHMDVELGESDSLNENSILYPNLQFNPMTRIA